MSDDVTFFDEIEAYCAQLSYPAGANAELHVSTRHDRFDVIVERWGDERETVWQADELDATFTPPPHDADSVGCRWPTACKIPIDGAWRSGFYLVTVTAVGAASGRDTAHTCFVAPRPFPWVCR